MRKIVWIGLIMVLAFTMACAPETKTEDSETMDDKKTEVDMEEAKEEAKESEEKMEDNKEPYEENVYNLESLAAFDGKDGNKAYVAVDGIVYDVTDVKGWQTPHAGQYHPGMDYSEVILKSPHGKKKLESLTKVGVYEE